MKIAYFHPYFYKGIVVKNRVQNSLESAFMILSLCKTLKTPIFPQMIIRESKNRGPKLPIFQFYNTFIIQNFKIAYFSPNNYKGIILKIGVQNGLF